MALRPPILCYSTFVFLPEATDLNDNKIKFKLNGNDKTNIYYKVWLGNDIPENWVQTGNIEEDFYGIASFDGTSLCSELNTIYKFKLAAKETINETDRYYESDTILIQKSSLLSIDDIELNGSSTLILNYIGKNPNIFKFNINRSLEIAQEQKPDTTDGIAQYQIKIVGSNNKIYFDSGRLSNNKYDQIIQEIYQNFYSFNNLDSYILSIDYVTNYGYKNTQTFVLDAVQQSAGEYNLTVEENNEKGVNILKTTSETSNSNYNLFRAIKNSNIFSYLGKINNIMPFTDRLIEDNVEYDYVLSADDGMEKISSRKNSFENNYLTDENQQLIIKFDKTLSNYKQTFLSSSQTTIGSQYPLVRRAGKNNYKTFQIGGLISYQMESFDADIPIRSSLSIHTDSYNSQLEWGNEDEPHLVESASIFHNGDDQFNDWASVVFNENIEELGEDEIKKERIFRDKVIEFLSRDTIKLFRSATEGNILISLKDISLTPKDEIGRLVYTFSANATEIAPVNDKYLQQFKFIK